MRATQPSTQLPKRDGSDHISEPSTPTPTNIPQHKDSRAKERGGNEARRRGVHGGRGDDGRGGGGKGGGGGGSDWLKQQ